MVSGLRYAFNQNQRGRLQIDAYITLVEPGEIKEEDVKNGVIATVEPIGRDEFVAAGQKGMKARHKFNVWGNEYNDEQEVEYNGRRMTIYRSYGPKDDGKIELYAGERAGNV